MEFKGTKGKWTVEWNGFYNEIISSSNSFDKGGKVFRASTLIHMIEKGAKSLNNCEEDRANALLISKAPEMLHYLSGLLEDLKRGVSIQKEDIPILEQLIKEATEL